MKHLSSFQLFNDLKRPLIASRLYHWSSGFIFVDEQNQSNLSLPRVFFFSSRTAGSLYVCKSIHVQVRTYPVRDHCGILATMTLREQLILQRAATYDSRRIRVCVCVWSRKSELIRADGRTFIFRQTHASSRHFFISYFPRLFSRGRCSSPTHRDDEEIWLSRAASCRHASVTSCRLQTVFFMRSYMMYNSQ